jgi:hypothetical protein
MIVSVASKYIHNEHQVAVKFLSHSLFWLSQNSFDVFDTSPFIYHSNSIRQFYNGDTDLCESISCWLLEPDPFRFDVLQFNLQLHFQTNILSHEVLFSFVLFTHFSFIQLRSKTIVKVFAMVLLIPRMWLPFIFWWSESRFWGRAFPSSHNDSLHQILSSHRSSFSRSTSFWTFVVIIVIVQFVVLVC